MPVLVAGSVATDHLMRFPGKFSEQLLPDQLHKVSLSFLVDELEIRRGGCGPNISYAMAQIGGSPVLIGAVGEDFAEYRAWLDRHGVDTRFIHISETRHTARFVCTTDSEMCQLGTFYTGAMAESRFIELQPAWQATGADLVILSAYDPAAMLQHTEECRERGYRFAADPSQQIAWSDGDQLIKLVEGADMLFTNDYEKSLLESKTGLTEAEIRTMVNVQITTLGADGVEITGRDFDTVRVGAAKERAKVDPTGVGDAFRAGLLTGREWGLSWERSAEIGGLLATIVLETMGTQEYEIDPDDFTKRLAESYGDDSAAEIEPYLKR
ncbi:MAG TPA: carbohydrate kinase family protein [Jatrophihabitans sp.]